MDTQSGYFQIPLNRINLIHNKIVCRYNDKVLEYVLNEPRFIQLLKSVGPNKKNTVLIGFFFRNNRIVNHDDINIIEKRFRQNYSKDELSFNSSQPTTPVTNKFRKHKYSSSPASNTPSFDHLNPYIGKSISQLANDLQVSIKVLLNVFKSKNIGLNVKNILNLELLTYISEYIEKRSNSVLIKKNRIQSISKTKSKLYPKEKEKIDKSLTHIAQNDKKLSLIKKVIHN